jgi:hypothetical protein
MLSKTFKVFDMLTKDKKRYFAKFYELKEEK